MKTKTHHSLPLASLLLAASLLATPSAFAAKTVINADFEKSIPPESATWRTDTAIDNTRAHAGKSSLRVSKKSGVADGTYYLTLDGKIDFNSNCDFSVWVYAEPGDNVGAYLSADDGSGARYTIVDATGTIEPGKWCQLSGTVPAGDWRRHDSAFRLNVRTKGTCWLDNFTFRSGLPETPAQVWPKLKPALNTAADKRLSPLSPGGSLALDSRNAALAPDTATTATTLPADASTVIPAEGLLVFAIDAKDDLDITGSLTLEPDADLRPGIRATVLCDDTVIGAPSVKAAPWKGTSTAGSERPGPAPDIRGATPPSTVQLAPFRMSKGRHYITIAGPHIRPAGAFAKLELRAKERPAEKPLYTFGVFSDTHLGFGRSPWMNLKLNARSGDELEASLRQLKRENAAFAIIAGDMTDGGRRSQLADLNGVVRRANLPVYACLGNHDTFRDSRKDIAEVIPKLFPSGPDNTNYTFTRGPLRFIVLDGAHWRAKDGSMHDFRAAASNRQTYDPATFTWLRDTLAKDTATPAIVISHFEFFRRRGISSTTGYNLGNGSQDKDIMAILAPATNVVATINGHFHHTTADSWRGITALQNAAFAEWPNSWRVCRVYADRLEWETRQMSNRGTIREGVVHSQALLWMLSTDTNDLAGSVSLAPRAPLPAAETVVNDSFEGARLPAAGPTIWRLASKIETTRAHSGQTSLRVAPSGGEWGTVAYELDYDMDFSADAEFSAWVYAEPGTKVTCYITAQAEGQKNRHTVANATGTIEPGKWCQLKGRVSASQWRKDERDVRFIVRAYGPCWIDDTTLRAVRSPAKN